MVEQLLFISERDRRYIQLNVVFLTTCVNNSDEDSWGDLKRLLKYLKVKKTYETYIDIRFYVYGDILGWCIFQ